MKKNAIGYQFGLIMSIAILLLLTLPANSSPTQQGKSYFNLALENGKLANEGFWRSFQYLKAWLEYADPVTGLIPKNLDWQVYRETYKKGGRDIWNARDNAADNYPYMVLASAYTSQKVFTEEMPHILKAETLYTSRVATLPDDYSFSKQGFWYPEPDMDRIIFGASEYIKDGLLAITEWLGTDNPWFKRMVTLLDDVWFHAAVKTPYGAIPSTNIEVNGEMLQVLARLYWISGDNKYLNWAIRLGNYYLLGNSHPTRDLSHLRLRDHGGEIISGLCELYATLSIQKPEIKKLYERPLHDMLDRILLTGRNSQGFFYSLIDPVKGKPLSDELADTWGYILYGYYTVYLVDKTDAYRQAVLKLLANLHIYRNYDWERGSMDGYADAIEGAITLYNHETLPSVADWIDSEIQVLWQYQKPDGLIEGWHCDGNFARTSLIYSLWKTQGLSIKPWDKKVIFGAVQEADKINISLTAGIDWQGKLLFDTQRHKLFLNLPFDWPRINQLPEWYTVSPDKKYKIKNLTSHSESIVSGKELIHGVDISLPKNKKVHLVVMAIN